MGSIWDMVIIGGGPAGLTAGLYAARAGLKTVLLEQGIPGGTLINIDHLENYPGFADGIPGSELAMHMMEQATRFGLQTEIAHVTGLEWPSDAPQGAWQGGRVLAEEQSWQARTVVVSTGSRPRLLGVPGEERLTGRGVSYCATCDGALFRGKVVAVVGGGDSALSEAIFLTRFAERVLLIHRRDQLRGIQVLQERARENPKIAFHLESVVEEIQGQDGVQGLVLKHRPTGKTETVPVDGVFIYVGADPATGFLPEALQRDARGYIIVNDDLQTSLTGVFAAGDVRLKKLRQVATAVGDGAQAAMAAGEFLVNCDIR